MNGDEPGGRELLSFKGPVQCRLLNGAANLMLRGQMRDAADGRSGTTVEVLFSAISAPAVPALAAAFSDARLLEFESADRAAPRRFCIVTASARTELQARALQMHRDPTRAFFAAVPTPRVPMRLRFGWSVLLWLLRLPGAQRLVQKLRGSA